MTCYNLNEWNCPVPVRSIRLNGRRIANPPDDLVIQNKLGYPKVETPQPEYDPQTQYLDKHYELQNDVIIAIWEICEIPPEPEPEPEESVESDEQGEPQQEESQSEPEQPETQEETT